MMATQLDMDDNKDSEEDKVMIAETTDGDWIWGIGLNENPAYTKSLNKWKGCNILEWGLMQARNDDLLVSTLTFQL
eukprot:9967390-Ditylum_brightwellii.AAC.1